MSPEDYVIHCTACTIPILMYEFQRKYTTPVIPPSYLCWTPMNEAGTIWDGVNVYCGVCRGSGRYPAAYGAVYLDTPIFEVAGGKALAAYLRITNEYKFTPAALQKLTDILLVLAQHGELRP